MSFEKTVAYWKKVEYNCGCRTIEGRWFKVIREQCRLHEDPDLKLPYIMMYYTPIRKPIWKGGEGR